LLAEGGKKFHSYPFRGHLGGGGGSAPPSSGARVAGGSAVQSRRRVAVQIAEQAGSRSRRGADCRVQSRQGAAAGSCDGRIRRAAAGRSDRGERQARSSLSGRILHCTAPAALSKEPRTTSGGRIQIQIAVLLLCFFNLRPPKSKQHLHSTTWLLMVSLSSICLHLLDDSTSTPRHYMACIYLVFV
jgi:hypothetical protein